jgi:hypothetical protein
MIDVLCPTYKRHHELRRVAKNLEENTKHPFALWFGLEEDDVAGQMAAKATGHNMVVNRYEPGYSNTIQTLYEASKFPFIIHANDDFDFHPEWDVIPLSMFEREDLMVVGMPQTEGDTHGSAISMFRRKYIEEQSGVMDMPNRVFYPYPHHYVDTEFTLTAQHRGVWAKCDSQGITHMHPGFTGLPTDATYQKNDATSEKAREIFETRKHLWGQ